MQLTDHFNLAEFEVSQAATRKGIDNSVPLDLLPNLTRLAQTMEQVRSILGKPISINSGYRSREVNALVGGANKSAHLYGRACDFICPAYGSPRQIVEAISVSGLTYDQIIEEGTWVHLAIPSLNLAPRQEILTARFVNGKATYTKGLA